MFQMNPLEILTLVLMLLVVAGCIAVVVVAVRWLRSIGLRLEQDRTDRLERERMDAERDAADAARRREDQDAQVELVKSQGEVAAAQAQLMKEQAELAREHAEAARSEARAHDARAVREAAEARRADAAATLAEARTRIARAAAEREEVEVRRANAEADRAKAETQRAAVDEELSRVEARRAEAETRRADAQADAVRDGFQGGSAGRPESVDGPADSRSPADGRAVNPLGSAGGFLPAHGVGSGWNGSLSDLSDVLGSWGGKAGKDAPRSGFPIDPRLLNLLPEDARKLLGGLKRPEDAEALFEWLRTRFGEPPQNRRRGSDGSRRPTGFQPNDTGPEDSDGGDSGGIPADDASGRGSAMPPAGLWADDDGKADRGEHGDRGGSHRDSDSSDRSGSGGGDEADGNGTGDGVRSTGGSDSEDGAEQVTDAGDGRGAGSSWGGPWTGGIDVGALIEEALRERHSRSRDRDSARGESSDDSGGDPPNGESGEASSREEDDSDGATDISPDGDDD